MHAHQGLHSSKAQLHKLCLQVGHSCLRAAIRSASNRLTVVSLRQVRCSVIEPECSAQPEQHPQQATDLQGQVASEAYAQTGEPISTDENVQVPGTEQHNAAEPEQPSSNSQQQRGQQPTPSPYSFYLNHPTEPVSVQLPPSNASSEPAAVKPYFVKSAYRSPAFLRHYPGPQDGAAYNYISFLGSADPNGGKFLIPQQKVEAFLESYFNTMHHLSRRMHMAECYNDHPYKYFQELDFPWDLDINLVLALIPRVIQIVTEETCRIHKQTGPLPTPVVSMRTPYKVHLNYPNIITVEALAGSLVRKAVINRCRKELSGQPELKLLRDEQQLQEQLQEAQQLLEQLTNVVQQLQTAGYIMGTAVQQLLQEHSPQQDNSQQLHPQQQQQQQSAAATADSTISSSALSPADVAAAAAAAGGAVPDAADLDWESIIDFPHGSLRMIGSCKAPWMDSDPEWVEEKCYSQVEHVDGVWMRQPLKLATIQQCSILLTAIEQMLYEQSDDFLEASYQSVKMRQQTLGTKSVLRRASKCLSLLQALQAALQNNNQEAVATLTVQAYQNYMLVNPDVKAQQEDGQISNRQQRLMQQQLKQASKQASEAHQAAEQQQKKQQALEKLKKLQAGGVGSSPSSAAAERPNLVRPLGVQQSPPRGQRQ